MNNKMLRAVIFIIILFLGIEFIVFPDNAFFVYKKDYQRILRGIQGKEVQVLFLGDSHTAVFDPSMLNPTTYNLAFSGDSPREMYLKMLYALKESSGLKYLFLEADPHLLCAYRFTAENKSFIRDIVPRREFNSVYALGQGQSFIQGLVDKFPFLSADLYVLARKKFLEKVTRLKFRQEKEQEEDYSSLPFEVKKREAKHRSEDHFSSGVDPDLVTFYQKIIGLCEQNGIHVIGIRYPVSREYLQDAKELQWSNIASQINRMGFERVLDYSSFFSDPGYFKNTDHINSKSAKILLERIHEDLPAVKI